jgi:hypothetical protein
MRRSLLAAALLMALVLPARADVPPGTDYVSFWSGDLRIIAQDSDTEVELVDITTGNPLSFGSDPRIGNCLLRSGAGASGVANNPFVLPIAGDMFVCSGGLGAPDDEIQVEIFARDAAGGAMDKPVTVWTGSSIVGSTSWGSLLPSSFDAGQSFGSEVGTAFTGFLDQQLVVVAPREPSGAPTVLTVEDLTNSSSAGFDLSATPPCSPWPHPTNAPCLLADDPEVQALYSEGWSDDVVELSTNGVRATVLTGRELFRATPDDTVPSWVNSDWSYSLPSFASGDDGQELGTLFYAVVRDSLTIFPTVDGTTVEIVDLSDGDDTQTAFLTHGLPGGTELSIWTAFSDDSASSAAVVARDSPGTMVTELISPQNAFDNDLVRISSDQPILVNAGPAGSDTREMADVAFSVPTGPDARVVYTFAQNYGSSNDLQLFAFDPDTQVTITSLTRTSGFRNNGHNDFLIDFSTGIVVPSTSQHMIATGPDKQWFGSGIWNAELLRLQSNRPITVISGDYDTPNFGAFLPFVTTSPFLPPTAVISGGPFAAVCVDDPACVEFDGSASFDQDSFGPAPDIVRYDWDFGDGEVAADAGPLVCHTFVTPGLLSVRLTVADNEPPPDTGTDVGTTAIEVLPLTDPSCDPCSATGCTLTQGYWKTHNLYFGASCLDPWPISEDTLLCGERWVDVLWTAPGQARAAFAPQVMQLAHQWIAARLNVAAGAATTPDVDDALLEGDALLGAACADPASVDRQDAVRVKDLLADFNEGSLGPGHCDDLGCSPACQAPANGAGNPPGQVRSSCTSSMAPDPLAGAGLVSGLLVILGLCRRRP